MLNLTTKALIVSSLAAAFAGAANYWLGRDEKGVCRQVSAADYVVTNIRNDTLVRMKVVPQDGAATQFGDAKVSARLGVPSRADILVVDQKAGKCLLYMKKAHDLSPWKITEFPLHLAPKTS